MTGITRCPQCGTRFKVSQAQLDACRGTVRCGCCQTVFNAIQPQPGSQPGLQPAPPRTETPPPVGATTAPRIARGSAPPVSRDPVVVRPDKDGAGLPGARPRAFRNRIHPAWAMAVAGMSVVILMQALYFFRVEFAAHLPGIRPALLGYCELLDCTIPLPQKLDQLRIESSAMESAPGQAGIVTLHAILRNRAAFAQTYPDLVLTLTNPYDEALARRIFSPAEYLEPGQQERQGMPPNDETAIELYLDTGDLKPAGYRLLLSYSRG